MADVLDALLRVNLVASAAILAVLVLRLPARRRFGPEVAYRLWAAPPLAAVATLMPLKVAPPPIHALTHVAAGSLSPTLIAVWAVGLALAAVFMGHAQLVFLAEARRGRAGPAVVGVLTPRVVMPPDDGRYTADERALIRAHEREHITRKDPRAGALIALFQCLGWFNPLVHLAAHVARLDQELACDAAVVRRHPKSRALYAKTLLKTQLATAALPLGCYWPARSRHPLEVRVGLLRRTPRDQGLEGPLLVGAAIVTAAILAWSAEPPLPTSTPFPPVPDNARQDSGQMSVMLVTWPAPRASAAH
ncbi:MAG TPA: M56 family metallopeptidase [Phenylobacterium sp.]|jgi:beta-lactamase regulating signal transducer with metallopeptidase domain|nr:M56 family metallopeptidase [Phenylobacterium sp.]